MEIGDRGLGGQRADDRWRPAAPAPSASEPASASRAARTTAPPPAAVASAPVAAPHRPPAPATRDAQVVVLGAGPGGYTAAFRAADLGPEDGRWSSATSALGGVCLNVGCIPSKALLHAARVIAETEEMAAHGISFGKPTIDLGSCSAWKAVVVDRLTRGLVGAGQAAQGRGRPRRARSFTGAARADASASATITFENCIIAAGSSAVTLPFCPTTRAIIDSTGALSPTEIPKRLLVIGGGIIGLEMARVYDALGSQGDGRRDARPADPGLRPGPRAAACTSASRQRYEAMLLGTRSSDVKAQKNGPEGRDLRRRDAGLFDQVLVAVGRRPNGARIDAGRGRRRRSTSAASSRSTARCAPTCPGSTRSATSSAGPMLAHKATHEGKVAAEVIAGIPASQFDARAIPSVAYTDPEVAWMGLTETAAKAEGIEYREGGASPGRPPAGRSRSGARRA